MFAMDDAPLEQGIMRSVQVHISQTHKDFHRIKEYVAAIIGQNDARRMHFLTASYICNDIEMYHSVNFKIQ